MVLLFRLHFGLPGGLLRAFWSLVERLGGVLGASWEALGSFSGRLEGSRGSSWSVLGRSFWEIKFGPFFGSDFGTESAPKGRPFGSQNGTKIEKKSSKNANENQHDFGRVFFMDFDDFGRPILHRFCNLFPKHRNFEKTCFLYINIGFSMSNAPKNQFISNNSRMIDHAFSKTSSATTFL